ncbi:IscS subfamily cysteine desulfurase [Parageobacillus thermoglucosidasius]|uniref:IscS subfamily cysteine desulfurase n=1 Tax=Parageobacillus thermoglucosidasius TaxID=1426 RepID=UPI000E18BFE2|nr:IscS subfamily cysteine desulfurase [Parageobacillus thermoglucosidasius]MED4903894.1 IscS subfamily cysteine desulfurase [Parageobacillus thermoglucosidasius]MED4912436.1 IscS subfamily cysteine desulfurase [Parageobacillus thermoglucosidasius]MED4944228.1 IscS subfamily cysteine desulfurase [Parageobacillus thermoglucosidasius]MED4981826.1 IscS subfamily cysteine desulfurase [Parageobacillus thermoglucosidasius]RDE20184.1 aminotransferase class V-fold PLP-dependent enzyme [Parageobacillus
MIYLDYAATTPMSKEAINAFVEAATAYFGNASSLHDIGSNAERLLTICRQELAALIGGEERGIYFTSGGTEANILAIRSLINAHRHRGNHLITTKIEHASLYHLFQQLETEGFEVTYLPVNQFGQIDIDDLERAITPKTILASIQHANSEIGTIQPVAEIGWRLRHHGVIFHSDCVQTFGKIRIDVKRMFVDSLSVSAHKIYGPKGVGAVYIDPRIKWQPCFPNATHEYGFRPGTVNVPGIASFVTAAQHICDNMDSEHARFEQLRRCLLALIREKRLPVTVEGHPDARLPHIVGLSAHGIEGQYILLECNRDNIAISTGSACQVGKQAPSRTMLAVGKSAEEAKQFIRVSFGKWTTEKDIHRFISSLERICQQRKELETS